MDFWGFFHQFWRIFYIKNAYAPPYLPPDPPQPSKKAPHPLTEKILQPPTFFNVSTNVHNTRIKVLIQFD